MMFSRMEYSDAQILAFENSFCRYISHWAAICQNVFRSFII